MLPTNNYGYNNSKSVVAAKHEKLLTKAETQLSEESVNWGKKPKLEVTGPETQS